MYERIRDGAFVSGGSTARIALVGREAQLGALKDALQSAHRGHGVTVLLTGQAGIGKSRLLAETVATARLAGWTAIEADAGAEDRLGPYGVWAAVLRS